MPSYTLSGVEVEFPFDAYPCQLEYMTKVIQALQQGEHALLESPTGTGKTLCLLCATLAWRKSLSTQAAAAVGEVQQHQHSSMLVQGLREAWAEHRAAKMAEGGPDSGLPQIIYSSRTHSQLQQVMRELKRCSYNPRTAIIASRQHGCLHPTVSAMQSGANQACRALVSKRACKWYNGVEKFVRQNPDANKEVLDIEDLGRIGQERTACPFYLARELASSADIVFLPYNYLLDAKTRGGLGISWQGAVLIFDEAHNVEQVCSDSMSFDLPAAVLAGAIEELGTAAEVAANKGEAPVNVFNELGGQDRKVTLSSLAPDLQRGRAVLCRLEQEIAALKPHPETGLTRPGAFLFELLGRCGISAQTWHVLQLCLESAMSVLTEEAMEAGRRTGSRSSTYCLHQVMEALRLAFVGTAAQPEAPPPPPAATGGQWPAPRAVLQQYAAPQVPASSAAYRVHVHMEKSKSGRVAPTLSYWCFSPGLSMQQLTDMKVRSVLLTSGTLSPLDSFAHELALPFPVRLENPHVIDEQQVWVGVVPVGPSGQALNSSYQNRENTAYRTDLGLALVNLCRIIPDGLLVFFPSYALLQSCIATWKQAPSTGGPSIWERIAKSKQPVIEPRESAAFNAASDDFRAKLLNPAYNGAAFFAVTRGKASEGLDFSDAAGRAVVLTGIPYAMKTDPKVRLKQEILNDNRAAPRKRAADGGSCVQPPASLSGDQWYSQNAMRAVNQAVGRVIRHRRDYGAIILCDERFRAPNIQRQLSCWLRGHVTVYQSYGAANASLVQFFKQQGAAARKGLVVEGGQCTVPGMARAAVGPFNAAAVHGGRGGAVGPFQGAGDAAGRSNGSGRSLLQQVPAAIDAVGMTELFAPVAAAAAVWRSAATDHNQEQQAGWQQQAPGQGGGGDSQGRGGALGASRLMVALGNGSSTLARQVRGPTSAAANSLLSELAAVGSVRPEAGQSAAPAAGLQQQAGGRPNSSGVSKLFEPRPWERAALAVSARPCPPKQMPAFASSGGRGAAGNVVGPAHLVAKHAERQRQRSASVEPEQAAPPQQQQQQQEQQQAQQGQPPASAAADKEAQAGGFAGAPKPGSDAQAGQPPEHEGEQQRQQVALAAVESKGSKHAAAINAYLAQLKATLSKDQFTRMRTELSAYNKGKDLPRLLEAALPLLQPHPTLLDGFSGFLPKSARPALQQQLQQLQEAPARSVVRTAAARGTVGAPVAAAAPGAQQQHQQLLPGGQCAHVGGNVPAQHNMHQQWQQQHLRGQPAAAHPLAPLPGASFRQPFAQQQQLQLQRQPQQPPVQQRAAVPVQKKLQQRLPGGLAQQQPAAARPVGPVFQPQQQQPHPSNMGTHSILMPPRGMQQAMQSAAALRMGAAGCVVGQQQPARPATHGSRPSGRAQGQARGPACPVCGKAPMDAPHEAGCGHSACYTCWLKALAQFKCPVCSRAVRKSQLTKKYFA